MDHVQEEINPKSVEFDNLLLNLEAAEANLLSAQTAYDEACKAVLAVTGHPGMAGTFNFDSVRMGVTYIVPREPPKISVRRLDLRRPGSR